MQFDLTFSDLAPNEHHRIIVEIGSCYNEIIESVTSAPLAEVYNGHWDGESCFYDQYCKGSRVTIDGVTRPIVYHYTQGSGSWLTKCKVPGYCSTTKVKDKGIPKNEVSAYEYLKILEYAFTLPIFPADYINALLDAFNRQGYDNCDKIRYCPANLKIAISQSFYGPGSVQPLAGGCWQQDCSPLQDPFPPRCIGQIIPSYFDEPTGGTGSLCSPLSYRFLQLLYWMDEMALRYPATFPGSNLYNFLEANKSLPGASCATVTFCLQDFRVLYHNLNTVDCSYPPGLNAVSSNLPCTERVVDDNLTVAFCPAPCYAGENWCMGPVFIYHDFNGFNRKPSTNGEVYNAPKDESLNNRFSDFGVLVDNGIPMPKGIIRDDSSKYYFYDYTGKNEIASFELSKVEGFWENWDLDLGVYVAKLDSNAYAIRWDSGEITRITPLWGSGTVKYQTIVAIPSTNTLVVSGSFSGALTYGDVLVGNSEGESIFALQLTFDAQFKNVQIFKNTDVAKPFQVLPHGDSYSLCGTAKSNWLGNNEEVYTGLNQGNIFIGNVNGNGLLSLKNSALSFNPDSAQLLKIVPSQHKLVYLMKGKGNVRYNNVLVSSNNNNFVSLVSTPENSASIAWQKMISGLNVGDLNEMDIAADLEGGVVLALTFSDSIIVDGQKYFSTGKKDILVLRVDSLGNTTKVNTYGSADNETVRKVFYNGDYLFLGGEYDGTTLIRTIGGQNFLKLNSLRPNNFQSYIAYIPMSGLLSPNLPNQRYTQTTGDGNSEKIKVYPNPFNGHISFDLSNMQNGANYEIAIYDLLGHLVHVQKAVGGNIGYWDAAKLSAAQYIYQIKDRDGTVQSGRLTKINR